LGSCTKDVRETNNQASSLLQPKIFLLAAVWDLSWEMHHLVLTEQLKDEGRGGFPNEELQSLH
jgi:hypothetical protein